MSRRALYPCLLVSWLALTLTLTSVPDLETPNPLGVEGADKAAHLLFYGVMGLLCCIWRRERGSALWGAVLFSVVFTAVVGAVDELHQRGIPGRSTDFLDWIADAAGGGAGAIAARWVPRRPPFAFARGPRSAESCTEDLSK